MRLPELAPYVVGEPYAVKGYLHTIQISLSNFVGKVSIEACIVPNPTEEDWFKVSLGGNRELKFDHSTTKTVGFTVKGAFVMLRGVVDREGRSIQERFNVNQLGNVDRIIIK